MVAFILGVMSEKLGYGDLTAVVIVIAPPRYMRVIVAVTPGELVCSA